MCDKVNDKLAVIQAETKNEQVIDEEEFGDEILKAFTHIDDFNISNKKAGTMISKMKKQPVHVKHMIPRCQSTAYQLNQRMT